MDSARPPTAGADDQVGIVVLCTANICRSPMGEALLADRLGGVGVAASVTSAGELDPGIAPPPEAVAAMAAYGLDTAGHRSRRLAAADLEHADLVVAMARSHARHAVVLVPDAWPRTFTLKELVRRGRAAGPRRAGEGLAAWLGRVGEGRERSSLLGDDDLDDVADPIGGPPEAYTDAAGLIAGLVEQLVVLAWPAGTTDR